MHDRIQPRSNETQRFRSKTVEKPQREKPQPNYSSIRCSSNVQKRYIVQVHKQLVKGQILDFQVNQSNIQLNLKEKFKFGQITSLEFLALFKVKLNSSQCIPNQSKVNNQINSKQFGQRNKEFDLPCLVKPNQNNP